MKKDIKDNDLIPFTIRLTKKEYDKLSRLATDDNLSFSRVVAKMTNNYYYNKYTIASDRELRLSTDQRVGAYKVCFINLGYSVQTQRLGDILSYLMTMDSLIPLDKVSCYKIKRYDEYFHLSKLLDDLSIQYPSITSDKDFIALLDYLNNDDKKGSK